MNLMDSISEAMGFGTVTDVMVSTCSECKGEGFIKVGENDNMTLEVCPKCTCKTCNKQPCDCINEDVS